MSEALLFFYWMIYFYLHSLLAATSVKLFFTRFFFIKTARVYRIAYNLFSFAGLILLIFLQLIIPSKLLFNSILITDCISFCLLVSGLSVSIIAVRNYDWKSFIGITKEKNNALVIAGMNNYVRHPLYSGTMLFVSGYFLWQPYFKNILLWLLMWIYLAVGIMYEERKLVKTYGDAYKNYQKKVKKMIPFIW